MTSEEKCIAALRTAADQLGESPTKAQYEELGLTPASGTIIRSMGGWNAAKETAELETNRSTGSRVAEKPDDVTLPDGMVWEELSKYQRWHYKNRDWNSQRSLNRRQRHRAWLRVKKGGEGCAHCGEDDPACLDFHHQEAAKKEMKVSKLVTYGFGKDKLRREIGKCEVLCANCHRKEHHGRDGDSVGGNEADSSQTDRIASKTTTKRERMQMWANEYQRERGCCRCSEYDPTCLQFHHIDLEDKVKGVGAMISDSNPEMAIQAEVEKCEVLCANCHRKEHDELPQPVR